MNRLASAGGVKGGVKIWDANTGKPIASWPRKPGVSALAFSRDLNHLAIGDEKGGVHILNAATGKEVVSWKAQPDRVTGLTFLREGAQLLSASRTEARIWANWSSKATRREALRLGQGAPPR